MERNPLFLTLKYRIGELREKYNVHDFQIRDHFTNESDLYVIQCACSGLHKHDQKKKCRITNDDRCLKCNKSNELLIESQSLLFHNNLFETKLYRCCVHVHHPPCGACLKCKTSQPCVVQKPFECSMTTGKCSVQN